MIGTEAEAREGWWCPMARIPVQYRQEQDHMIACNRGEHGGPIGNCLASECALWRWYDAAVSPTARGYCGLAAPGKSIR